MMCKHAVSVVVLHLRCHGNTSYIIAVITH